MRFRNAVRCLCAAMFLLLLAALPALSETVKVPIPVHCKGPALSVVMTDEKGKELSRMKLETDKTKNFYVEHTEPGDYKYVVKQIIPSSSEDKVKYDTTVYYIHVFAYMSDAGKLEGVVSLETGGAIGVAGKPTYIEFKNVRETTSPAPTKKPSNKTSKSSSKRTPNIRTGDTAMGSLAVCGVVSALLLIAVWVLVKRRRNEG